MFLGFSLLRPQVNAQRDDRDFGEEQPSCAYFVLALLNDPNVKFLFNLLNLLIGSADGF